MSYKIVAEYIITLPLLANLVNPASGFPLKLICLLCPRLLRSGPGMMEGLSNFRQQPPNEPIYDKTQLPASLQERLNEDQQAYNDGGDWGGRRDSSYREQQSGGVQMPS